MGEQLQLVDQVALASSIISEEDFGSPPLRPMHVYPDGLLSYPCVFSDERERFPSSIDS